MQSSSKESIKINKEQIKSYLNHDLYIALSVLLGLWGIGLFLIFYTTKTYIGFILLVVCWLISFLLFQKLPPAFEKVNGVNYKIDDIESLKNSYEIDKKNYQFFKKISIGLLVLFILIIPIIASVFYFITEDKTYFDYLLGGSVIGAGIVFFFWIRKKGKVELLRKLIIE